MKTLRKGKVKKAVKKFRILKVKELLQIKGGGDPLPIDKDFD